MGSRGHFVKQYWNYYLELEHQVINTRRYVEFDTKNYNTYSIEYVELLQAICSEIDVLGKVIAQLNDDNFKVKFSTNIKQWGYELQQAFPSIDQKCIVFDEMIEIYPFKNWRYTKKNNKIVLDEKGATPFWWLAYNSVKHARTSIDEESSMPNFQKANLKNVIYALGALFLMEKFVMKEYYGILQEGDGEYMPKKSKLFIVRL